MNISREDLKNLPAGSVVRGRGRSAEKDFSAIKNEDGPYGTWSITGFADLATSDVLYSVSSYLTVLQNEEIFDVLGMFADLLEAVRKSDSPLDDAQILNNVISDLRALATTRQGDAKDDSTELGGWTYPEGTYESACSECGQITFDLGSINPCAKHQPRSAIYQGYHQWVGTPQTKSANIVND